MRSFLVFSASVLVLASFARADPIASAYADELDDQWEEDASEGRILFTSNSLGLNSTVDARALLAALLLGLLFALVLGYSFLGDNDSSGYGYGYQRQGQQQQGYGGQNFYQRSNRNHEQDMASQMALLANAFEKYQVTNAECQMYVACEAALQSKHDENGALAKQVFDIMGTLKHRGGRDAIATKNEYLASLYDQFVWGEEQQFVLKDACEKQRRACVPPGADAPKKH